MPDLVTELSQRARELAPEDRARLAEELLASLEGNVEPEVDAAWDEEVRKRIAEVENGTVKLVPADEVFARVRRVCGEVPSVSPGSRSGTCGRSQVLRGVLARVGGALHS